MKHIKGCLGGLLLLACMCFAVLGFCNPVSAAGHVTSQQIQENIDYYSQICMSADTGDVDWDLSKDDTDLLEKFHAEFDDKTDEGFEKRNAKSMGFFDWIMDLFDWWDDTKDEVEDVIDDRFSDEGIPSDPYKSEKYGMNLHDVDTMTVDDYKRSLAYAGTWVRITISSDEVADRNWGYRLEPALTNIKNAADELGVVPNIVINLSGYSNHTTGSKYLLDSLSWEEKAERYKNMAFALTNHVHLLGFTDTIFDHGTSLTTMKPAWASGSHRMIPTSNTP
jgi:hypothetical protein